MKSHSATDSQPERCAQAIDMGCGYFEPVRRWNFAVLFKYDYSAHQGPKACYGRRFDLNVIVATTKGEWEFHGARGRSMIDRSVVVAGVEDDTYGCRHNPQLPDSALAVCLRPGAVDSDFNLFSKEILPSNGVLRLLNVAASATSDDAFETAVFTLFDTASHASKPPSKRRSAYLRMQRAKRFIENHAFEQLQLGDIALEIGLSPFTTLRQFRESAGKPP